MHDAPVLQTNFTFSTNDIPERDRFSAWREMVSATHDVRLAGHLKHQRVAQEASFEVTASIARLGDLMVSSGRFSGQVFTRTHANIRHDQLDHYGLFAQGEGWRIVRIDDRESILRSGDLILFDMTQPVESIASDGTSGTLYLARDIVEDVIPQVRDHHGMIMRGASARMVAQHIHVMGGDPLDPQTTLAPMAMAMATRDLAFACLSVAAHGHTDAGEVFDAALRWRIECHIDTRLDDPDLSVASICTTFYMSRSTLYRIFGPHGNGGVASLIKQRRLARIHTMLVRGHDRRSLADIALDYGFQTGAHFSREFRRAYGYPPSELRGGGSSSGSSGIDSGKDIHGGLGLAFAPPVLPAITLDRMFHALSA
jgi:AraC-like DNA-binding protein